MVCTAILVYDGGALGVPLLFCLVAVHRKHLPAVGDNVLDPVAVRVPTGPQFKVLGPVVAATLTKR
jgi:hypothetical protein